MRLITSLLVILSGPILGGVEAFQVAAPPVQRITTKQLDYENIKTKIGTSKPHYALRNEQEIICPVTGASQGFLCAVERDGSTTLSAQHPWGGLAGGVSDLAKHVGIAGSIAAALRNPSSGQFYYLATEATLHRSPLPREIPLNLLKENEVDGTCLLYACNTSMDSFSATSDVYLVTRDDYGQGVWRLSVDYKIASVNLSHFPMTAPRQPDILLGGDLTR